MAKLETLYYQGEHGRSYYRVRCSCGEEFDFYCWSSVKKCPKCGFLYGHGDQVAERENDRAKVKQKGGGI